MELKYIFLPAALMVSIACGSAQTSSQLQTARADYQTAKSGPASRLELVALAEAEEALKRAEAAHADDPGSHAERSLAYVASRRARIAMAKAGEADAKLTIEQAKARHDEYERALLAAQRNALEQTSQNLEQTSQDLEQEREARLNAEKREQAALASLRESTSVREDERGLVLTLSGSVLFETAKSELLPSARDRLGAIARSLADLDSDVKFRIEGHTDSRGTEQYNEQLSRERAQSVADYLVSHQLDRGRIEIVGLGESQPIASNDTAEGRANNRRVEIVISDPNKRGESSVSRSPAPSDSP